MKRKKGNDLTTRSGKKANEAGNQKYVLRLYVAGMTPKSKRAVQNIKTMCEGNLKGRYELEVIDIMRNPVLAAGEQIIATPTLIRKLPLPIQKFIGDLTEVERVLVGVDLTTRS